MKDIYRCFKGKKTIHKVAEKSLCCTKRIGFYSPSDTLVFSLAPIIKELSKVGVDFITVWYPFSSNEGAKETIQTEIKNVNYAPYTFSRLIRSRVELLVFANDWSPDAKQIIAWCRLLKIPTVCIQESVIDFSSRDGRMCYSDHALLQGEVSFKAIERDSAIIVGNPRYESIKYKERDMYNNVLINVNFTYGVYEEERERWLSDILSVLKEGGYNISISQHPRDDGDLSLYDCKVISSSASSVACQLENNDILITRFSSLIHEAIESGMRVVYYNPHKESLKYDFKFDSSLLYLAESPFELKSSIDSISNTRSICRSEYARKHYRPYKSLPSRLVANWLVYGDKRPKDTPRKLGVKYLLIRPLLSFLGVFK